jgi:hypothetical protein
MFYLSSVAWLIGWALVLEYTIGGSAVARGISPNLVSATYLALWNFDQCWLAIFLIFINCISLVRHCFLEDQIAYRGF